MTTQNNLNFPPINTPALIKRMIIGAGIALFLMLAFFILPVINHPNPDWGKYWMIKPLVIMPIAGASGGAFFYLLTQRFRTGLSGILAYVFSAIAFIIALWMGTVLGLNGTMWH